MKNYLFKLLFIYKAIKLPNKALTIFSQNLIWTIDLILFNNLVMFVKVKFVCKIKNDKNDAIPSHSVSYPRIRLPDSVLVQFHHLDAARGKLQKAGSFCNWWHFAKFIKNGLAYWSLCRAPSWWNRTIVTNQHGCQVFLFLLFV